MLYENIKAVAKEKKIQICEIEKTLGIAPKSLCKWNDNKPAYDKVVNVAKLLNVSVEELVGTEV